MMKQSLTMLFLLFLTGCFAQPGLQPDTTTDYRERFYENGRLKTTNPVLYTDNEGHYYSTNHLDTLLEKYRFDTTGFMTVENGLWVSFYDKKWNDTDSTDYVFYSLVEFHRGYTHGKCYYFRKDGGLIYFALRYPIHRDTIFDGYSKTFFRKDSTLQSIEYRRFSEDSLKGFYFNETWYYPTGKIEGYSLMDDFNDENQHLRYDKNGLCTYEAKYTKSESYIIERKRKGKIEIVMSRTGKKRYRTTYKNGKLVRQKELRDQK